MTPTAYQAETLTTSRLTLRALQAEDSWLYQTLYTCPKTMRNTAPPFTPEHTEKMFRNTLKLMNKEKPSALVWVIEERETNNVIGMICLYEIQPDLTFSKIGIMLLREANGKLYPEEAMAAVMSFGFDAMSLSCIRAEFMKRNLATRRFVLKLGFKLLSMADESTDQHATIVANQWFENRAS